MKPASLYALALIAGLISADAARAADFGIARPMMPPPLQEYGSGWYLRGDIGWTGYSGVSADFETNGATVGSFTGTNLEDTWAIGAGFGYQSGWFRADVTADYRAQSEFAGSALNRVFESEVTSWSTLLNGYFDLGSWSGITPYVGAGIGGAAHQSRSWRDGTGQTYSTGTNWDFAFAVMAGVAVRVSPHMSFDFGYRYVDLGQPESGFGLVATTSKVQFDNVTAHEVRAGLRYMID
ncbi:MAG: porin family protein [Methylacidiphilales bacterium]|nr:porin family protein [Candidatus Methylacidiphilales bacterium]